MRKTPSLRLISISTLLALAASALVASVSAADQPIVPADVNATKGRAAISGNWSRIFAPTAPLSY